MPAKSNPRSLKTGTRHNKADNKNQKPAILKSHFWLLDLKYLQRKWENNRLLDETYSKLCLGLSTKLTSLHFGWSIFTWSDTQQYGTYLKFRMIYGWSEFESQTYISAFGSTSNTWKPPIQAFGSSQPSQSPLHLKAIPTEQAASWKWFRLLSWYKIYDFSWFLGIRFNFFSFEAWRILILSFTWIQSNTSPMI